jgi:uncharacterized membrane protein (Fun14 family)
MKSLHGSLISTAFSGLGKAFALSIFQKVLTFLFNQAILQLVEPQVFGSIKWNSSQLNPLPF